MEEEKMANLLCAILNCEKYDLRVLDNVQYDLEEIIGKLCDDNVRPTLNNIFHKVFTRGVIEITDVVSEKIRRRNGDLKRAAEDDMTVIKEEIRELSVLDPKKDIEWEYNALDASVYIMRNKKTYWKYLRKDLLRIESHMGTVIR